MPHTWGPNAGRHLRRQEAPAPPAPVAGPRKVRVLFVCIGNSCRSQMAEGFALRYGADVMEVASAGLAPANLVAPLSAKAMLESKGIDLSGHWPKSLADLTGAFDIIINISGHPLPPSITAKDVRAWTVRDPVLDDEAVHLQVASQIESLVQQLVLELRDRGRPARR